MEGNAGECVILSTIRPVLDPKEKTAAESEKETYERALKTFNERVHELDPPAGIEHFYWYHTVDLGNGLVTPGHYDFRGSIHDFGFPENMSGLRVLDIGAATGYFSFEFAERGAEVTSIDLPSLYDWDMVHSEKEQVVASLIKFHQASSPEEAHYRHIVGPFDFCRDRKGLTVNRVFSPIYKLTPEVLGGRTFDMVYLGDILNHLFSPWAALEVVSRLAEEIYIATTAFAGAAPFMRFVGNRDRSWWVIGRKCLEEMLLRLGYGTMTQVGEHSGILRKSWVPYQRTVYRFTR